MVEAPHGRQPWRRGGKIRLTSRVSGRWWLQVVQDLLSLSLDSLVFVLPSWYFPFILPILYGEITQQNNKWKEQQLTVIVQQDPRSGQATIIGQDGR